MSGLSSIRGTLRRPPVIALLAALALGLLLWFGLPLIAVGEERPLASASARLVALLLVALAWGAVNLLLARPGEPDEAARAEAARRRAAREAKRAARIAARAGTTQAAQRLAEADRLLRALPDRGAGLPVFLLLGPSGAGKTALLAQSGLPFPLQARAGVLPESEGATEEIAAWLAERAIYLDTPGCFAAPAPLSLANQMAWHGLLQLLRRRRPLQAVNGVVLTVGLDMLATASAAERDDLARSLRYRLTDIEARFGFRPPCHVVFTRADAVAGFSEFFSGLPAAARAAPLGTDVLPDPARAPDARMLAQGFAGIMAGLTSAVPALLQREPDPERRVRILEFPAQFAAQRESVLGFLATLVEPSRQLPPVFLRRFSFASVPGGAPEVDALAPLLDGAFGLAPLPPAARLAVPRRGSLLIQRLLGEVLPAEAGLAGFDPRQARRTQRGRLALACGSAALVIGFGAAFAVAWTQGRGRLEAAEMAVGQAEAGLARLRAGPEREGHLAVLDALAAAAHGFPGGFAGIGQEAEQQAAREADAAYRRGLAMLLYPDVVAHLRAGLVAAVVRRSSPAEVFATLRAYRMILGQGPLDATLLREALRDLPQPGSAAGRAAQSRHLDALLASGIPASSAVVDTALVERALAQLRGWSSVELGYATLHRHPAVQALGEWRIADHAGPAASRVLARRSGRGLLDGVPGLYTAAGFREAVLPLIPAAAREAAQASWVLGESATSDPARHNRIAAGILALYLDDYARAWEALLADVGIFPFTTVDQTLDVLNALSTAQSPYRLLLQAVAHETTLTTPVAADAAAAGGRAAAAALSATGPLGTGPATGALVRGLVAAAQPAPQPGQPVDDRFATLHAFVRGVNGQPAELDALTTGFRDLYEQMLQASLVPDSGRAMLAALQGTGGNPAALRVQGLLQRGPAPIRRVVEPAVQRARAVAQATASGEANAAWQARVLPLCRTVLDRFPFAPAARDDAGLGDVTSLFGPAGQLKAFFDEHLKPFVDTTSSPWTVRRLGGASLDVSPAMLAFMERAEMLRVALFPAGAETPRGRFEIEPVELDARALEMLLTVNGTSLSYRHGPPTPRAFEWPGPAPGARLTFSPPVAPEASSIAFQGTWALHRLLARATRQPSSTPDEMVLRLELGTRWAVVALRTGGAASPFSPLLYDGLRCPDAL